MREIHLFENVTLDGVMQAPAGPEEDFPLGGWALPYADAMTMEPGTTGPGDLLLGRRTYLEMERGWRSGPADNPFTAIMNAATKYVVSRTLREAPDWQNSVLLAGEATEVVADLKQGNGAALTVLGSGTLSQALLAAGLVDGVTVLITPVVLGTGRRLFSAGIPHATLELVSSRTSPSGVILATYRLSR